eukprot:gene28070-31173_t
MGAPKRRGGDPRRGQAPNGKGTPVGKWGMQRGAPARSQTTAMVAREPETEGTPRRLKQRDREWATAQMGGVIENERENKADTEGRWGEEGRRKETAWGAGDAREAGAGRATRGQRAGGGPQTGDKRQRGAERWGGEGIRTSESFDRGELPTWRVQRVNLGLALYGLILAICLAAGAIGYGMPLLWAL